MKAIVASFFLLFYIALISICMINELQKFKSDVRQTRITIEQMAQQAQELEAMMKYRTNFIDRFNNALKDIKERNQQ